MILINSQLVIMKDEIFDKEKDSMTSGHLQSVEGIKVRTTLKPALPRKPIHS